jgi:hypothetical protein
MKLKLIAILLIFSAFGCGTQSVYYPTGTSKATIDLPDNNGRIVVLNRVRLGVSVVSDNGFFIPNIKNGMNGALTGFRNEINNRRYFTNVANIEDYKEKADGSFPNKLTASELKNVSRDADFVASLEMLEQRYRDDYTIEIRRENLGDNVYKEVDFFVGKRTVIFNLGWRLYNAKTGEMIDEWETNDEYSYEAESRVRVNATNLLESKYPLELNNLGQRLGRDFATRVSPTNHYIYRNIYTTGNKYLENGAIDVRKEDWENAEKNWLKGVKFEKNRKKLAKLYHNLAMAEEKKGNPEKAKEYAKLASYQHPLGRKTQGTVGY